MNNIMITNQEKIDLYRDIKIPYLNRIFKRRKSYYDKNGLL